MVIGMCSIVVLMWTWNENYLATYQLVVGYAEAVVTDSIIFFSAFRLNYGHPMLPLASGFNIGTLILLLCA